LSASLTFSPITFRAHFVVELLENRRLDLGREILELVHRDIALLAGLDHARQNFLAAESLAARVLLDDDSGLLFRPLVRREALAAGETLAATPYGVAFPNGPRIDDAVIVHPAKRTLHASTPRRRPGGTV
jgi:hypothetical protein